MDRCGHRYLSTSNYDFSYDRAKNLRPKRNIKTAMNNGVLNLRLVTPGLGEARTPGLSLATTMAPYKSINPTGFNCVNILMQKAIKKVTVMARKRQQATVWAKSHRVQKRVSNKAYSQRHHKDTLKMSEDWRKLNRPRVRAQENERNRLRVANNDDVFIVKKRVRARLLQFMKNQGIRKNNSTFEMIDMDKNQLADYLMSQLDDGEHLKQYDIDHIFPLESYSFDGGVIDPRCMHYSNMQPLPPFDNGSKLDKLPTKAMSAKVDPTCWPDGITMDMLPDIYPGWATPLRM